jgi:hypothetical protein
MRWGAGVAVVTAALACAETPTPAPAGATAPRPASSPYDQPAASTNGCLSAPSSAHPGCYHPGPPPPPDPRFFSKTAVDHDASLSKGEINVVVRQHLTAIKCCYDSELKRDPALAGSLVVGWTIEPSGVVSRTWIVEQALPAQPTLDCIGEEICGWAFPAAEAPTKIGRYPFIFKNGP